MSADSQNGRQDRDLKSIVNGQSNKVRIRKTTRKHDATRHNLRPKMRVREKGNISTESRLHFGRREQSREPYALLRILQNLPLPNRSPESGLSPNFLLGKSRALDRFDARDWA